MAFSLACMALLPFVVSATATLPSTCPFWQHANTQFAFEEVIGFTAGNISFDDCCTKCRETSGCAYFSARPQHGCTLGSRATNAGGQIGTMSGSVIGPALPKGWTSPKSQCEARSFETCEEYSPGDKGPCKVQPQQGRGGRCEASDSNQFTIGRKVFSCAPVKMARNTLAIGPFQFAQINFVPDCSASQCTPPGWIKGTPGCSCSSAVCCAKEAEYCSPTGCAAIPQDTFTDFQVRNQHPRCWATDETTGDLFCTGLDEVDYINRNGTLVKLENKARCGNLGGVDFFDVDEKSPSAPASTPPKNGFCGADFCACCASGGAVFGGLNSTGTGKCAWKCSMEKSKVSLSACEKPMTALSKCGENAFPHAFDPCKSLCAASFSSFTV